MYMYTHTNIFCAFTQSKQNNKISTIINFLPFLYSSSVGWFCYFFLWFIFLSLYFENFIHVSDEIWSSTPCFFSPTPLQPLQHPSTSVSCFLFLCLILLIRSWIHSMKPICIAVGPPSEHWKPAPSHVIKEWFSFPQQLSTASDSSVTGGTWRSSASSTWEFWLVSSCAGLGQAAITGWIR